MNMVLNIHRNRKAYWGRGEGGKGVWRRGKRETIIPIATLSVNTRMTPALRWAVMRAILMFH